jgi:hypothetical protein
MKGVLAWLVRWARRADTRDFFPSLADLVSPGQNIFCSPYTIYTISIYVSQSPSNLGRQSLLSTTTVKKQETRSSAYVNEKNQ